MVFLEINGYEFPPDDDLSLYHAMIEIAEDRLDKYGLAEIFRKILIK